MKLLRPRRAVIWILWVALVLTAGCELTRDYSAVPLQTDASTGYGKQACSQPEVEGTVYYVSTDGSSDGDGTRSAPWDAQTAAEAVEPGATVLFRPGTYRMSFKPAASGEADAPIVLRSERRHAAKMAGQGGNTVSFDLEGVSHVRVEGFKFVSGSDRWIDVLDAEHIVLSDLWLEDHQGVGPPLRIHNSRHVSLLDSVALKSYKFRLIDVERASHLLIAGNSFSMNVGRPLIVVDSDQVVIRANVFHNQLGKSLLLQANQYLLMEHNIVTNGAEGPGASTPETKLGGDSLVIRYNRVFRNWGTPFQLDVEDSSHGSRNPRIYHNVIDDTRDRASTDGEAWRIPAAAGALEEAVFKNNIFSRNGSEHGHLQLSGANWGSDVALVRNAFWAGGGETPTVRVDSEVHTLEQAASEMASTFLDNLVDDPAYVDAENFDHRLAGNSELIDSGNALTTTRGEGAGTSLAVEDAHYFFDGFGIGQEVGDLVRVGRSGEVARIIAVDHATHTLSLDRSISWNEGDDVHLVWAGDGPDIGAWEDGLSEATPAVIERSAFVVDAGSPVMLSAQLWEGVEPARFEWRLGDGTRTCGRAFEHVYEEPGDYAIRLKVYDESGRVWRAVSYLLVDAPGTNVDSIEYNKQLMDDYLCDGEPRGYTGGEAGYDKLVEKPDQGYVCAP